LDRFPTRTSEKNENCGKRSRKIFLDSPPDSTEGPKEKYQGGYAKIGLSRGLHGGKLNIRSRGPKKRGGQGSEKRNETWEHRGFIGTKARPKEKDKKKHNKKELAKEKRHGLSWPKNSKEWGEKNPTMVHQNKNKWWKRTRLACPDNDEGLGQ